MQTHYDLTDSEFETQFKNCTLNPELFSHEAHLRLAWLQISKYGIDIALKNIPEQLQAFVRLAGAAGKYNHTLTIAATMAVNHFFLKSKSTSFSDFIAEFPQLKNQFKELMQTHYETNIFTSPKAKTEFIEPDRVPF